MCHPKAPLLTKVLMGRRNRRRRVLWCAAPGLKSQPMPKRVERSRRRLRLNLNPPRVLPHPDGSPSRRRSASPSPSPRPFPARRCRAATGKNPRPQCAIHIIPYSLGTDEPPSRLPIASVATIGLRGWNPSKRSRHALARRMCGARRSLSRESSPLEATLDHAHWRPSTPRCRRFAGHRRARHQR